jgi:hypothetical protein
MGSVENAGPFGLEWRLDRSHSFLLDGLGLCLGLAPNTFNLSPSTLLNLKNLIVGFSLQALQDFFQGHNSILTPTFG